MKLSDLQIYIHEVLKGTYVSEEINAFLYRLLDYRLQWNRLDLVMRKDESLVLEDEVFFKEAIFNLLQEKPIQYILGETSFYGYDFKVNEHTLIPRPETEELVDWIVKDWKGKEAISIIDIGTGTGCIPISLAATLPQAEVLAVDVSEAAIDVAKSNASMNQVVVEFVLADILKPPLATISRPFDVIVSNPPYVRHLEKEEIKKNVLAFEPHLALFVEDDDALLFYRVIANFALKYLKENGALYFEINQYLGNETVALLKRLGFSEVTLKKDMAGNDRMIKAVL